MHPCIAAQLDLFREQLVLLAIVIFFLIFFGNSNFTIYCEHQRGKLNDPFDSCDFYNVL